MNDDPFDAIDPSLEPAEYAALRDLAERLTVERPVPRAAFRAATRARLFSDDRRPARSARPRHLRALITAYAATGAMLLAIAALGTAGSGPLAPSTETPPVAVVTR